MNQTLSLSLSLLGGIAVGGAFVSSRAIAQSELFAATAGGNPLSPKWVTQSLDVPASLKTLLQSGVFQCMIEWDFDADGDKDLVIGLDGACYLLRNGPGTQPAPLDQPWGWFSDATNLFAALSWGTATFNTQGLTALAVGDIDGDGREDLVAATVATPAVFTITFDASGGFVLNAPQLTGPTTGTGTFGASWQIGGAGQLIPSLKLVDAFNAQGQPGSDGQLDIFACIPTTYTVSQGVTTWYPGRALAAASVGGGMPYLDVSPPAPSFGPAGPTSSGSSVLVSDFDGDGLFDLFMGAAPVASPFRPGVSRLYRGDATLGWVDSTSALNDPSTGTPLVFGVLQSNLIDSDSDNDLDVVVATPTGTEVLLNNGTSPLQFSNGPVLMTNPPNRVAQVSLAVADFDGDGLDDVLDPLGALWLGSSTGLVQSNALIATVVEPAAKYMADARMVGVPFDVDWDGDMDWLAIWDDPDVDGAPQQTSEVVLLEWMNITRQLDGPTRPKVVDGVSKYYSFDRQVPLTGTALMIPWLAADVGPLPVRIPNYLGYSGLLGLDPNTSVGLRGISGLWMSSQNYPGEYPLDFTAVPPGAVLYYQALHLNANPFVGGYFTNVLRIEVQP